LTLCACDAGRPCTRAPCIERRLRHAPRIGSRAGGSRSVGRSVEGDGLHLSGTFDSDFRDLELVGNERAGALFDLGGESSASLRWEGVVARGSGDQLGVVGQDGTLEPRWDAGIVRAGATLDNDARFFGSGAERDVLEPITPEQRPDLTRASIDTLEAVGISVPEE